MVEYVNLDFKDSVTIYKQVAGYQFSDYYACRTYNQVKIEFNVEIRKFEVGSIDFKQFCTNYKILRQCKMI